MALDPGCRGREAVTREHMQSENVQEWDRTMATFSHPRYELPDGRVYDGRDVGARQVFEDTGFGQVSHPTKRRVVMRIDFD